MKKSFSNSWICRCGANACYQRQLWPWKMTKHRFNWWHLLKTRKKLSSGHFRRIKTLNVEFRTALIVECSVNLRTLLWIINQFYCVFRVWTQSTKIKQSTIYGRPRHSQFLNDRFYHLSMRCTLVSQFSFAIVTIIKHANILNGMRMNECNVESSSQFWYLIATANYLGGTTTYPFQTMGSHLCHALFYRSHLYLVINYSLYISFSSLYSHSSNGGRDVVMSVRVSKCKNHTQTQRNKR